MTFKIVNKNFVSKRDAKATRLDKYLAKDKKDARKVSFKNIRNNVQGFKKMEGGAIAQLCQDLGYDVEFDPNSPNSDD